MGIRAGVYVIEAHSPSPRSARRSAGRGATPGRGLTGRTEAHQRRSYEVERRIRVFQGGRRSMAAAPGIPLLGMAHRRADRHRVPPSRCPCRMRASDRHAGRDRAAAGGTLVCREWVPRHSNHAGDGVPGRRDDLVPPASRQRHPSPVRPERHGVERHGEVCPGRHAERAPRRGGRVPAPRSVFPIESELRRIDVPLLRQHLQGKGQDGPPVCSGSPTSPL